uniref:Uncharacterized protein n=1 Tax=Myotis myotis TaxID=51298 RepID=A0A7J7ZX55_MYOMY|nr:hypothetical protein mMyoMyo1_009616 [Myotis myotis]
MDRASGGQETRGGAPEGRPGRNLTHRQPLWSTEKSNYWLVRLSPKSEPQLLFLECQQCARGHAYLFTHSVSLNPHSALRAGTVIIPAPQTREFRDRHGAFPGHEVGQWSLTLASALPITMLCCYRDAHSAPLHCEALASQTPHLQGHSAWGHWDILTS